MNKAVTIRIARGLSVLAVLIWGLMRLLGRGSQEIASGGFEPKVEVRASALQKPVVVVTEENSQSTIEFAELAQNVMNQLPRRNALRGLDHNEVHHTPNLIIEAGDSLGLVAEAWKEKADLKKPATDFYRECSLDDELPDSIRILCLSNWSQLARELKVEGPESFSQVPERLLTLALYMSDSGS